MPIEDNGQTVQKNICIGSKKIRKIILLKWMNLPSMYQKYLFVATDASALIVSKTTM